MIQTISGCTLFYKVFTELQSFRFRINPDFEFHAGKQTGFCFTTIFFEAVYFFSPYINSVVLSPSELFDFQSKQDSNLRILGCYSTFELFRINGRRIRTFNTQRVICISNCSTAYSLLLLLHCRVFWNTSPGRIKRIRSACFRKFFSWCFASTIFLKYQFLNTNF